MESFMTSSGNLLKRAQVKPKSLLTLLAMTLFLAMSSAVTNAQEVVSSPVAYSSCYITSGGTLYVWGNDNYLQPVITSNTTPQDSVPVAVKMPAGVTSWKAVATGQSHIVALGSDGNLYAWGLNNYGQLGDSSTANDSIPVMVKKPAGVTSWTAVAAGAFYSMAIANNGDVYAWGFNNFGQLGNGTTTNESGPTLVKLPSGVTATKIAAGTNFGLAVGSNDSLYTWGRNVNGELGVGSTVDQHSPVGIPFPAGVTSWTQIGAGAFTSYALGNDGNLYSAGSNGNGQIGDGTTTQRTTFTKANLPGTATGWKSFSGGASFCLAIASNDTLYDWGYGSDGELGNGTTIKNNTSLQVVALPAGVTATSFTAGHNHSVIIGSNGHMYSWGMNSAGELGTGTTAGAIVPVYVNFQDLAAATLSGPANGAQLTTSDSTATWGSISGVSTYELQVSDNSKFTTIVYDTAGLTGTTYPIRSLFGPVLSLGSTYYWRVVGLTSTSGSYSAIASFTTPGAPMTSGLRLAAETNSNSSYLINAKDTLFTWGNNQYGQLGNGTTVNDTIANAIPFPMGVTGWKMVAGGQSHTVALGNNDTLYAWGQNNDGQLGNGTTSDTSMPVMVSFPTGVKSWTDVAAGVYFTVAIGNDGNAYAWGVNNLGQLGDTSTTNSSVPMKMGLPAGVKPIQVYAGNNWSMILCSNGEMFATGRNANGQLGDGTKTDSDTLVMVQLPAGVTGWLAFAAGGYHAIAIGNDGNLYGWGNGGNGQLANGGTASLTTPTMIAMPVGVTGWGSIACGENFIEAVGNDGNIYEAGYSNDGESGNGTTSGRVTSLVKADMMLGVSQYVNVAAGHNHVLAIANNDSLYAWGANSSGQLGDDSTSNSLIPVKVLFMLPSIPSLLSTPMLVGPATGDTLTAADTALVWMSVPTALSYEVQIASDSGFSYIVVDSTVSSDTAFAINNMIGTKLTDGTKYFWRVKAKTALLSSSFSLIWSFITPIPTGIAANGANLPKTFALMQNYPNPFNPSTEIKYNLPKAAFVTLKVYNVLGQEVATLVNGHQSAGYYDLSFNMDRFASGVYFYILRAGNFVAAKKMMLLK